MSIEGLSKISIYEPVSKTVAQFNQVRAEGQLNISPAEADADADGSIPYGGDISELEAVIYDLGAAEDQVKAWMQANTPVAAVGLGLQVNFLWQDTARFRIIRPNFFASGQRRRATITANREGGIHKIDHRMNLLSRDDLLETPSANVKRLIFPVEGATLTLSRDFSGADANVTLRALDSAGVELASAAGSAADPRTVVALTLPAATWHVEADLGQAGGQPALRSDGVGEYVGE